MRLGRLLVGLVPDEAEAHGLVALMELQASRTHARTDRAGNPVLLLDQDRGRWDRLLITRGLAALDRASSMTRPLGPYTLQAAIAACHARASTPAETDWPRIVALYDGLVEVTGSPVVELNRAVAVSMAYGPAQALELVDELAEEPALRGYHLLPAVRADLLMKLGRHAEAKGELERAAALTENTRERALLLARAAALD
jgi:predicted RNA polymerase sigma factor